MELIDACQFVIFGLACWSIVLAVRHAVFFWGCRVHIGGSMLRFLLEQVVCSLGTLVFSANSLYSTIVGHEPKEWNNISPWAAIAIRAAMFMAMIHSTSHLARSIREIVERQDAT